MKYSSKAALIALGLVFSTPSWALLIDNNGGPFDGTDVGSIDTLIDTTTDLQSINPACPNGSSEAAEMCWAKSVTGLDYALAGRQDPVQAYTTDDPGVIAFQLAFGPGTYIVKNSTDWGLFTNLANLSWGVIDTGFLAGFNLSDTQLTISHVTEFDGTTTKVPEPGTLSLLGAGLVALGLLRRKRSA